MQADATYGNQFRERIGDFLLSLAFMLLLILPALLMKVRDDSSSASTDAVKSGSPLVFLPETVENLPDYRSADNIYAWIRLRNPFSRLLPDCEYGFGGFVPESKGRTFDAQEDSNLSAPEASTGQLQDIDGTVSFPSKEKVILLEPIMGINVTMPPIKELAEEEGIFWMNEKGHVMVNPPEISLVDARLAIGAGPSNQVIRNTVLQVLPPSDGDTPPRIVVRSSCNNTELDRYAVQALRKRLIQAEMTSGRLAIPDDGIELDVLWKIGRMALDPQN